VETISDRDASSVRQTTQGYLKMERNLILLRQKQALKARASKQEDSCTRNARNTPSPSGLGPASRPRQAGLTAPSGFLAATQKSQPKEKRRRAPADVPRGGKGRTPLQVHPSPQGQTTRKAEPFSPAPQTSPRRDPRRSYSWGRRRVGDRPAAAASLSPGLSPGASRTPVPASPSHPGACGLPRRPLGSSGTRTTREGPCPEPHPFPTLCVPAVSVAPHLPPPRTGSALFRSDLTGPEETSKTSCTCSQAEKEPPAPDVTAAASDASSESPDHPGNARGAGPDKGRCHSQNPALSRWPPGIPGISRQALGPQTGMDAWDSYRHSPRFGLPTPCKPFLFPTPPVKDGSRRAKQYSSAPGTDSLLLLPPPPPPPSVAG
ncbi:hypothetical protein J0S82_000804, partial [Galemys pyrenaicus]